MATLTELGIKAYNCAIVRGKINPSLTIEERLERQKIAVQNEVQELLEAKREFSQHIPSYTAEAEEAADVIIAALSLLALMGEDIDRLIEAKMNFNETREK